MGTGTIQLLGWDKLTTAGQQNCDHAPGIRPADENKKPKPQRTHGRQAASASR